MAGRSRRLQRATAVTPASAAALHHVSPAALVFLHMLRSIRAVRRTLHAFLRERYIAEFTRRFTKRVKTLQRIVPISRSQ
jgi:hypothetical protein